MSGKPTKEITGEYYSLVWVWWTLDPKSFNPHSTVSLSKYTTN